MDEALTRFWFSSPGRWGVGVSAYSLEDARAMIGAEESLRDYVLTEVIEDIDIQNLDQDHVVPNMGTPSFRAIWFPNITVLVA